MSLEWSFQLSLQSCGISHFSWVYFYPRFRKGCGGGENRASLKEWFLFGILSPTFYEKAFSKRSLKCFRSPGSSTSMSFKIWKAFPPQSSARLSLQGDWLNRTAAAQLHLCLISHTLNCSPWVLDCRQLPTRTWKSTGALCQGRGETFFFFLSKKQIHVISRGSMRQGHVFFFFLTCSLYSVSGWEVANYLPGLKGAATRITASHGHYARRKSRSGLSSRDANWNNSLCLRVRVNKLSNVVAGEEMFAGSQSVKTYSLIFWR